MDVKSLMQSSFTSSDRLSQNCDAVPGRGRRSHACCCAIPDATVCSCICIREGTGLGASG